MATKNDDLGPWMSGDEKAQEQAGYEEGRRIVSEGEGWPDGDGDTPYGRGLDKVYRESQRGR